MAKTKGDYTLYLYGAIVCIAIIVLASFVTYHAIHEDDEKDQWSVFADEFNYYTEYQLDSHSGTSSTWSSTPGYIYITGKDASIPLSCGRSFTGYPVYTYVYYVRILADDDCLRIEHHSSRYSSDGSDAVISVSYIPYTSISYVQVNKVIE